ncbi:kinase-like domain-containing protein [Umbelopsis sp. PMI_123]|nr:kinase-like domain-containing protein [Umbelopsis sp. PMI_123]
MSVFRFDDDDHPALRDITLEEELASGPGNTIAHLRLIDSNPPSGYNSDTDEAKPSEETDKEYEVKLNENFVSSKAQEAQGNKKVGPDDFQTLKVIGKGAFGTVTLVKHKVSGSLYAMKVLKKASLVLHLKEAEHTKAERQILEDVSHPFIVKLFYAFQTKEKLHMILEYASGGELFTHLAAERMFSEEVASFYAAELILALEHLHSLGIIYRDLKPENCLLDMDGHVVLTDFGLSKVSVDEKTNTVCGTVEYMAPEVLMEMHYDQTVDWWSLGVLMYDMLTGSPPFGGNNRKKTMENILKKKLNLPYYMTPDAKDILNRLLRKNPNVRLGGGDKGVNAIKKHRFFRKIDWKALQRREVEPPIVPVIVS